ncbi:MAG: hypothetical protein ACAI34_19415 [Verrucomicrobium sp.]|nr:hypothetical protein [Verrucomicrobium sp.]
MKTAAILLLTFVSLTAFAADSAPAKSKPYPLKTCAVSGEDLGTMGKPYVFVKDGQEVKLCCKSCLKDFEKEPAKYLKEISEKAPK